MYYIAYLAIIQYYYNAFRSGVNKSSETNYIFRTDSTVLKLAATTKKQNLCDLNFYFLQ